MIVRKRLTVNFEGLGYCSRISQMGYINFFYAKSARKIIRLSRISCSVEALLCASVVQFLKRDSDTAFMDDG